MPRRKHPDPVPPHEARKRLAQEVLEIDQRPDVKARRWRQHEEVLKATIKDPTQRTRWRRFLKQSEEEHERMWRADVRMGVSPEQRLHWIIEFARKDLDVLGPGERVELGYDLRALPAGLGIQRASGPMDDDTLRVLHGEIGRGLRALTRQGHTSPESSWDIRIADLQEETYRTNPTTEKAATYHVQRKTRDERGHILLAVRDLILQAGARLTACPECGRPFLARRRQEFCSAPCGQRVRDRRRREKKHQSMHR